MKTSKYKGWEISHHKGGCLVAPFYSIRLNNSIQLFPTLAKARQWIDEGALTLADRINGAASPSAG